MKFAANFRRRFCLLFSNIRTRSKRIVNDNQTSTNLACTIRYSVEFRIPGRVLRLNFSRDLCCQCVAPRHYAAQQHAAAQRRVRAPATCSAIQRWNIALVSLSRGGFVVRRPIGDAISECDPFLMLDHLGPVHYAPGEAVGAPGSLQIAKLCVGHFLLFLQIIRIAASRLCAKLLVSAALNALRQVTYVLKGGFKHQDSAGNEGASGNFHR